MTLRRHHHGSRHTHSHVDTSSIQGRRPVHDPTGPGLCQHVPTPKVGPDDEQIVPPLPGLPWLPVQFQCTLCSVSACLSPFLLLSRFPRCLCPSTNCVHVAGINTHPPCHSSPLPFRLPSPRFQLSLQARDDNYHCLLATCPLIAVSSPRVPRDSQHWGPY